MVTFSPIFVADTKINYDCDFAAPLKILKLKRRKEIVMYSCYFIFLSLLFNNTGYYNYYFHNIITNVIMFRTEMYLIFLASLMVTYNFRTQGNYRLDHFLIRFSLQKMFRKGWFLVFLLAVTKIFYYIFFNQLHSFLLYIGINARR